MEQIEGILAEIIYQNEVNSYVVGILETEEVEQIEKWTELECEEIIFDSRKDNWAKNTSVFNDKIMGKEHLLFVIEDEEGEKFGYYLNSQIVKKYDELIKIDNKSFLFNLQSNGRIEQPRKYEILQTCCGYYLFEVN